MRSRHSLIEQFSSFLQFDSDRFQGWLTDSRLRRNMERCLTQATETSEIFWALYWHKVWQNQPAELVGRARSAREHLTAYVQEPCYWIAQKTASRFSSPQYTLADLFQMAIGQIDKVLKGFNPQQGFNLKNYASITLSNLMRESLRQRQEVDICTDWALLRKISQKRLTEALQSAGFTAETQATYLLAWTCFKTLYVPRQATGSQKLPKPDLQTWEAIAQLYNQERLSQPGVAATTTDGLEAWLSTCARAVRAYLYPNVLSINAPKPGQESGEFIDDLAETTETPSLLADLILQEELQQRQAQQIQIGTLLQTTIQQLEPQLQQILQFYYQDGLTQQQMAQHLETKQYTVSRRLTKARETLLKALVQWSETALHKPSTSDLLNNASIALEEWLKTYYHHPDLAQPQPFSLVE